MTMPIHPLNRRQMLGASAAAGAIALAAPVRSMAGEPDLSGKKILITGCASGFGYLGALHYARSGAQVFATMRGLPRGEAMAIQAIAEQENLRISVIEIDVLSDASVAAGVAEAERLAGGALDVLINNAGIGTGGPVEVQDIATMQLLFDTNVVGCQRMARAALPKMRAAKAGQIINISSQLGRVMVPNMGLYSATKFALESMSEQMAYELVPFGVDMTIVQPGGYPTKIWDHGNTLTEKMLEGTDAERKAAYAKLLEGAALRGGGSTDPMDVPRAIAGLIAMSAGSRPLRLPVHPGAKPQIAINQVSAQTQVAMLGGSPYGPWVKKVHQAG
jgi:NAD(P)-dependent dehydrogenase (short-subunit alcohol dehydrogenase family)